MGNVFKSSKPKPFQLQNLCPFESFFYPDALYGVSTLGHSNHVFAFGYNESNAVSSLDYRRVHIPDDIFCEQDPSLSLHKGKIHLQCAWFAIDIVPDKPLIIIYKYTSDSEEYLDELRITLETLKDFVEYQLKVCDSDYEKTYIQQFIEYNLDVLGGICE